MKSEISLDERNEQKHGLKRRIYASIAVFAVLVILSTLVLENSTDHNHDTSWHDRFLEEVIEEGFELRMSTKDVVGFLLATVGLMLAAGGGIGGGGMLVPIYTLVLGFDTRHAIPLSNITVLGGAVANTILNVRKRHPQADRPLIDWDLILIMEPMTIAGALVGANLNKLLPEYVIILLLLVVLSLTAHKTLSKAIKLHEKEKYGAVKTTDDDDEEMNQLELGKRQKVNTEALQFRRQTSLPDSPPPKPMPNIRSKSLPLDHEVESTNDLFNGLSLGKTLARPLDLLKPSGMSCDVKSSAMLTKILRVERRAPVHNVLVMVALFVVVLLLNVLKGGGAFPSPLGIECGSVAFWMAEGLLLAAVLGVTLHARQHLLRKAKSKESSGFQYLEGDIRWNRESTAIYPLFCSVAGFVAGLFGIGGGIVKGPIMLALGVHPAVASATSACMILFTSFTATTSFMIFGLVVPDYACFCLVMGFVATTVGQTGMSFLLRKYKRHSYIAFSIGIVVALSAVCMTLESVVNFPGAGTGHTSGLCNHAG